MEKFTLTLVIFLSVLSIAISSKQSVPLFLWSDTRLDVPRPVIGQTTTSNDFNTAYLGPVLQKEQNIVAFVQDKLSIDDITHQADVYNLNSDGATFHNLKNILDKHSNRQLSSIDNVQNIISHLKKNFPGKVHELKEPYNLKELPLAKKSNLILATLPSTGKSEAEFTDSLHKNDEIMKSVMDDLKSINKPYTALYTSRKPSKRSRRLAIGRHLLQDDGIAIDATFFNVSSYIYFYTTQIEVQIYKYQKVSGNVEQQGKSVFLLQNKKNIDTTKSKAGNDTGLLVVKYVASEINSTGPASMENIEMRFAFAIGTGPIWAGFWRLVEFNMTYKGKNGSDTISGENVPIKGRDIYGPYSKMYQFCYHCSDTDPYMQQKPNDTASSYFLARVLFKELSVQFATESIPMKENDDGIVQFGVPNDCVGFFTIPILSGIFAGSILIAILFFGVSMIASIETMDRFDDPKGKTITVNVAE